MHLGGEMMGCFDEVMVRCNGCGRTEGIQSKAGACEMRQYTLRDAPPEVMGDIAGHEWFCKCGRHNRVAITIMGQVV